MFPLVLSLFAALVVGGGAATPTITSFSPDAGLAIGGTSVTIRGTNFEPGAVVSFGATPASSVNVVDPTTIIAVTPPQTNTLQVRITVTNPGGESAVSSSFFTFLPSQPVITGIPPDAGPNTGGYELTIFGHNFRDDVQVQIEGAAEPLIDVRVEGGTKIVGIVPVGPADFAGSRPAEFVHVVNPNGRFATLLRGFAWVMPPINVRHVSPAAGPVSGGTELILSGEGFSLVELPQVLIGGVPATNVRVLDAVTLAVTTPPAARGGKVPIFIRTDRETYELADAFTYESGPSKRRPTKR